MYKVKAVYEYSSSHDDDLTFPVGQIITVTEEEDAEWLVGEYTDDSGSHHEGMFPRNFVEKYEPVAPPRPTRARKRDSEIPAAFSPAAVSSAAVEEPAPHAPASAPAPAPAPAPAAAPAAAPPVPAPPSPEQSPKEAPQQVEEEEQEEPEPKPEPEPELSKPVKAVAPSPPKPADLPSPASPVAAAKPPPPAASKPAPPPVSDKPSGNSFRDRIAAFNKAAAPPITPFKPSGFGSGGGSSNFIKKPFVAPPPSRNAFVPPPRDVPTTKIYRREEDPEIKEREAENLESAEKAGLVPGSSSAAAGGGGGGGDGDDEEPKPMMSLKERMARLQREQQEQAQRHADAAAKKEKPKRPPKKRLESHDSSSAAAAAATPAGADDAQPPPLERRSTSETVGRRSLEETHPPRVSHPPRRKPTTDEAQDGNDADMSGAGDTTEGQDDDLTERDDSDEKSRRLSRPIPIIVPAAERRSVEHSRAAEADEENNEEEDAAEPKSTKAPAGDDEDDKETSEAEEEEEETDPETRRREELRARIAKMSGGMGMMGMQGMQGMFGAPPPSLPKKKKAAPPAEEAASPSTHAPPVPAMMALPGLARRRSEEKAVERPADDGEDDEVPEPAVTPTALPVRGAAPPVPGGRPAPPPPPPPPPAAEADVQSPTEGSVSDDELSEQTYQKDPLETPRGEPPQLPPPPPRPVSAPKAPAVPTSARPTSSGQRAAETAAPASPTSMQNKRASRLPPPIPGAAAPPPPPVQTRPPPPPPPGSLSRQSTADMRSPLSPSRPQASAVDSGDEEEEEEVTEYEGDYDTDIANPVSHKNSLKAHARDSSLEDSASLQSPSLEKTPSFPPPVPAAPRAPPPIPSQPPPPPVVPSSQPPPRPSLGDKRRSVDVPRGPPPPPPPPAVSQTPRYDDEYDPYNYSGTPTSPGAALPSLSQAPKSFLDESYAPPDLSLSLSGASSSTVTASRGGVSQYRPPGPPPPPPNAPAPSAAMHISRSTRQSMDASRGGIAGVRRSLDVNRPSMESGYVANDLDLAPHSGWWLQPNSLPPQLQGRKDIFYESEESPTAKRGGKVEITRDLYILYVDYSQTVISVRFDPSDSSDVHLEQRHEPPPRSLRQDQLEQSYERFGRHIADSILAKKDTVVGDGTPQALVLELIKPFRDALLPVGTRAYGALVYSNLANASTSQQDEIRAGDIITLRNAKFQGKHGAMHAKYSMEVGKPDHVAIVGEWDGTKKKVRAWEQGRESKKVKLESYKLDDLRSGEVKIWRVMPRSWVGWEGQN